MGSWIFSTILKVVFSFCLKWKCHQSLFIYIWPHQWHVEVSRDKDQICATIVTQACSANAVSLTHCAIGELTFFMMSFEEKFSVLIKSNLFSSIPCPFDVISKKSLPNQRSWSFSPMSSSDSIIVLGFTFRSKILSDLTSVCDLRNGSSLTQYYI